jgi:hypothetical protein
MIVRKKLFFILPALLLIVVWIYRCDIYEGENKKWKNEVTVYFANYSDCPVYFYVDGTDEGRVEMQTDFTATGLGQGIHFLESYPWNDSQHACDTIYSPKMKNGETFNWEVTTTSPCTTCPATPTPTPTETPTPETTTTPSPTSTPA